MADYRDCYATAKRWLINRSQGKSLCDHFDQYPYKKVAIYGAGDLGKLLYEEIKDSNMEVAYFIDRAAEGVRNEQGIEVILIDEIERYENVDAIIISSIEHHEEISKDLLERKIFLPIVSLRDVIYEL